MSTASRETSFVLYGRVKNRASFSKIYFHREKFAGFPVKRRLDGEIERDAVYCEL